MCPLGACGPFVLCTSHPTKGRTAFAAVLHLLRLVRGVLRLVGALCRYHCTLLLRCDCVYHVPHSVWFWALWLGPVGLSPASRRSCTLFTGQKALFLLHPILSPYLCPPFFALHLQIHTQLLHERHAAVRGHIVLVLLVQGPSSPPLLLIWPDCRQPHLTLPHAHSSISQTAEMADHAETSGTRALCALQQAAVAQFLQLWTWDCSFAHATAAPHMRGPLRSTPNLAGCRVSRGQGHSIGAGMLGALHAAGGSGWHCSQAVVTICCCWVPETWRVFLRAWL